MVRKIECDILIVGAGVVGCAIARHLSMTRPTRRICVVESMSGAGMVTSSRNSGVIHSGIHENPDFLKSTLAGRGSNIAIKYAREMNIPLLECGMTIAVSGSSIFEGLYKEAGFLLHFLKNAKKRQVPVEFLGPFKISKKEPNIRAWGGLYLPDVCVIDVGRFVDSLLTDALLRGAKAFFNSRVLSSSMGVGGYVVNTEHLSFFSRSVINSAGLYADDVAKIFGVSGYKIFPWRGEYYEVIGQKSRLVNSLVYPAIPEGSPSKGIHFSPRTDGRLFIGPNSRPVPQKNYYEEEKTPPAEFLSQIRKFTPEIEERDIVWAYSGIRPRIVSGTEEKDFIISLDIKNPPLINLIGIESPGLASCMAIAEYVERILPE